jgi:hypothetical protein
LAEHTPVSVEQHLPAFMIDWSKPFASQVIGGEGIALSVWTPQPYAGENIALPLSLDQITNIQTLAGLTADQKAFLAKNGFVVIHSQEAQFGDIQVETSQRKMTFSKLAWETWTAFTWWCPWKIGGRSRRAECSRITSFHNRETSA